MFDETSLKRTDRLRQEGKLADVLQITPEFARRLFETKRSQVVVESVLLQIAVTSVRRFAELQRVQETSRRKTVVSVAKPILSWVMSAEDAELEAGELAELFEYSHRKAKGPVWSTIGPVLLWLSLPFQVFCGAWHHRRKQLAQRKGGQ